MNKLKYIIVFIATFCFQSLAFAKEDTLSTALPDIRVTADRILSEQSLKYNSYNIITKSEIERKNPWQTFEMLNSVPGIFINDYGGLGGLKTISMRGTSSSQSILMIDGIRISSSQSAIADLSIIPVTIFDEMEVVRGGSSAIYGGNSIGGVVNMMTSDFEKNIFNLSLNAGSFNEYFISGKAAYGTGRLNQTISAEYKISEGEYPFTSNENNKKYYRINSDYKIYSASYLVRLDISGWKIASRLIMNYSDRKIPGPFIENTAAIDKMNSPELTDISSLFFGTVTKKFNDYSSIYLGISDKLNLYNYSDKTFYGEGYAGFNSIFKNQDIMLNIKYNSSLSIFIYSLGFETGYSNLEGNQLDYSLNDKIDRFLLAVSGKVESEVNLKSLCDVDYSVGLRYDNYSDAGNALSAFAGLLLDFSFIPLQFKGQISNNFRPPSFNEMYYLNFGNKDLKPEKSLSLNLGLNYFPLENVSFQLDGFYMNTDDRIVSVPKSQVSWSAENISEVNSKGFELSSNINFLKKIVSMNFAYTFQEVRNASVDDNNYGKLIVYMPQEIFSSTLILNYSDFSIGTNLRYSGHYFSLPDNSYESLMKGYTLLDIFMSYKLKLKFYELNIRAECKNLLDEQYAIIKNYPMPGRFFRVGLTIIY